MLLIILFVFKLNIKYYINSIIIIVIHPHPPQPPSESSHPLALPPVSGEELESQGTAITWEDPVEREARIHLQKQLNGDTPDQVSQVKDLHMKDDLVNCCPCLSTDQFHSFVIDNMLQNIYETSFH